TETFAGMYQFTGNTLLVETAQAITNLGSDAIKFYMGQNTSGQSGVTLTSNITNLLTLARDEPSYRTVFDMPFRHFVFWAYPFANSDEWWGGGYNATQGAKDYREIYDLTHYLLTNYNNSGKTFYLGHWEGDGYLSVNGWSTNPSSTTIQGMIGWLNNRQQAVDDAKAATAFTNVEVYNYAECNRVRDAMLNGPNNNERVINYVIPYVTNLDYLSYSSYDAQNLSASDLYTTLNYMEAHLPTNKMSVVPGPRMWIGEYGWGSQSTAAQEPLVRAYIQRLMNWNYNGQCLPFILMWEMYSNYNPGGGTNYCLIDYQDNKVPAWYLHNYFYNDARLLVAQFQETNGRLPTDAEFTSLTSPLLNQPLPAPVNLAVTNGGAIVASNTVSLAGTLAQGVYGDSEAAMYVYYGRQDGGTNPAAWEGGRFVGINTNFNPRTFSVTLNNLAPQTNYFYRFYAANSLTSAWASASASFTTETITPSDFGSRMKISFSGYDRGETLTNLPVLVNLSMLLPGFSYQQFASPNGGDLRFTDAGGTHLIPHEIDEWNTNGTSSVWVNVPSVSTTNDFIWAYWGNPAAVNPPPYTTNGAAWPGFDLVYHLKENGFPYADSTLQWPAFSGVKPAQTSGIIGHGEAFNGSTTWLDAGAVSDLGNAFTVSAWVNVSPGANNIQTICANQKGGFGSAGFALFVNAYNTANGAVLLDAGDGSSGSEISTPAGVVGFGQWHLVTAAVNRAGGTVAFYVDGVPAGGGSIVTDFINNADLNFGRFTNNALYFTGAMDEARIQSGVQSSNWIWASWATVAANSAFENYVGVTQQPPVLAIDGGGGTGSAGISLTWPASGVGFVLYATTNLAPPVVWTMTTNAPVFTNNQWQINLPPDNQGSCFYRLGSQ
ncbi:MAG TPA: DUF2341 domain-containing protein, partial [Verrucomicrobiae bacterium]|nr:DUF2341 domain-containing protein [Verrucomicrobiae bacterium]